MKIYRLPFIGQQLKTVILANGEFPKHPIASSILNNCEYLVCCDGAINNLEKTIKIPDAIVGDCDSLSEESYIKYKDIIHHIAEQETNDLTKAVHFCLKQGRSEITILGATGKREDHTIANISLLSDYANESDVEMITDYGIFNAIGSDSIFESYPKQQISIISIDRNTISSENLVYKIENQIFTNWWQATLNESESSQFEIKTSGRTIVYRAFL